MGDERVRMRAVIGQFYDGRRLYIGDTFDARSDEVSELIALNLAVRATNSHDKAQQSEPTTAAPRRYKRRDLLPQ